MTSSSLNTTGTGTDARKEAPFDPYARQIDRNGLSYVDFEAVLDGKPDPEDYCNSRIEILIRNGRSEAFCREYRAGYDGAIHSIQAVRKESRHSAEELDNSVRVLCASAALNRACEAFPEDQLSSEKRRQVSASEVQQAIERGRLAHARAAYANDFGVIKVNVSC